MPDKNGWISVEERRPRKKDANENGEVWWWCSHDRFVFAGDWYDDDATNTHWQPCPQPGPPVQKVKKKVEGWVNIYPGRCMGLHETQEEADYNCVDDRIACVKLTGEYEVEE